MRQFIFTCFKLKVEVKGDNILEALYNFNTVCKSKVYKITEVTETNILLNNLNLNNERTI